MSDTPPAEGCEPTLYGPCSPYATVADVADACASSGGLELAPVEPEGGGEPQPGADAALVEKALLWASRRVFMATGYRFWGCCEATIRPCRERCSGVASIQFPSAWPWASWPALDPMWTGGAVPVWACGCPLGDPCGCSSWDRIPLPMLPARSISEVKIGAQVLDPSAYTLYAQGWLLRIDGEPWPSCQAIEKPLGEEGTWSVTYRHGLDLPPEGLPLVAQYAAELAKACKGGECSLGPGIRVVQRDGVEFAVAEPAEYRERQLTGFGPLDDWISLLNGGHVTEPPRLYQPGRPASAPILEPAP